MCLVRICVPAESLVRENSNPDKGLTFHEFVLPAKSERRGFDSPSPHHFMKRSVVSTDVLED